ncbi:cell division protein SepF [Actinoplanes sp. SE50]|uniref:cell division protein SepF n=1 Tax=unclassified Actinoplanes TaxID=2626549 RepID=UPI00023ECC4E|nr:MULTISPECIES: cell division protein SepF [unclassified Actinoplanes]AEV82663.1 Cell division protein sepF [Actinoplanes sp. SE50/110]ATO81059.1 cell division protein SepF [Actinoplanes sp. SE50]SLL98466.1 cell division protein SepF [Actinoplanes sp. SE50/110]
MSTFRKAAVWLGLAEEEDERDYEERGYRESSYRSSRSDRHDRDQDRYSSGDRYSGDFDDEEEDERPAPRRPVRSERTERTSRLSDRASSVRAELDRDDEDRIERSSVRSITRPAAVAPEQPSALTYSTRENLALAPQPVHQPQVQQRPIEDEQRYQITTLHPTTYREARTIGEHFRDGTPVIINLTEMDESDARRLVDFAAGLAFGLRGTIERVTNRVFLLSPANVQVTAEDKAKIAEGGFFAQS